MKPGIVYGWEDSEKGKWCLSKFPKATAGKPILWCDTQQKAMQEAQRRGLEIEWQQ